VDWVDYFGKKRWAVHEPPLQDILNNPKRLQKNKKTLYSDLGYIVLGALLERKYRKSLDKIFDEKIIKPLKLTNELFFVPLKKKRLHKKLEFYPSEFCPRRKKIMQGEVMDENAWTMGGVAGHAGLFGTAKAIHVMLTEFRKARLGKSRLISQKTFQNFCVPSKNRGAKERYFTLGFDTPTKGKSQSGTYFSKNSIGHLGYAGTSFWWDLDQNFWIILLTNRCYPSCKNKKISEFRPKLHDVAVKLLELAR
jgi:CubicO group peptidase (beta-lactamase class C family)